MTMTVENLRDILNGLVEAGLGANDVKIRVTNDDYDAVTVESASIYRDTSGNLVSFFNGFRRDA